MTLEPEGATPATVHNHAFEADGDWWETCRWCGLARAAHETALPDDAVTRLAPDYGHVDAAMREAGER